MNAARHNSRFRRLLAGLAVSQAGDWLYNLALLAGAALAAAGAIAGGLLIRRRAIAAAPANLAPQAA